MNAKHKILKQQYRATPRPMGIFQIRNLANEKVFIGKSFDLPGMLNRQRCALAAGSHPNTALQSDWQRQSSEQFAFEILDELTPREATREELLEDLTFLETCWLERLAPYGERGYNEPPKTRAQRLHMIARKRAAQNDDLIDEEQ
jgi:hypothetical protein